MGTNRRAFIAGTGAVVAVLANRRSLAANGASSAVDTLLAEIAEELLADYPENATALGIDNGARAALKSQADRPLGGGAGGHRRSASRSASSGLRAIDPRRSTTAARIDLDVVRTAHEIAAEGFAFPYGDVGAAQPELVLAQRALCRRAEYRRLRRDPGLPGRATHGREPRGRRRLSRAARSLCRPARRRDRAARIDGGAGRHRARFPARQDAHADQDRARRQRRRMGAGRRRSRRATQDMPGDYAAQAATIAADKIAPALDRQIAELEAHRAARDRRCRRLEAAAGRCLLRLGAPRRDDDAHDAGRDPRTGPRGTARAAGRDGRAS